MVTVPFFIVSLVCLITSIVLIITDASNRSDDESNRWVLFATFFAGIVVWFISGRQTRCEVWYEKFNGHSMAVYKNFKDDAITVYLGKERVYKYSEERGEWVQVEHDYYMDSRLLFSRLVGKLSRKELKNGEIEVYVRNPINLNEATKPKNFRAKSARMKLKENMLKSIEYYPIYMDWTKSKRKRVNQPQILEVLEINNDFALEIPKSFISYCEEQGIELPQSNRINYI